MNLKIFEKLIEKKYLQQHASEWRMFLEICELHLRWHKIVNPIAVELGISRNGQKSFYEQLLGVRHIGIDRIARRDAPDILGDTHNPKTLGKLLQKLEGKPINILFIDAGHDYKDVKKDFEMYSPLCSDIVVLHDIDNGRETVRKFWDELKEKSYLKSGEYRFYMFLSIYQVRLVTRPRQLGIGMIIKR